MRWFRVQNAFGGAAGRGWFSSVASKHAGTSSTTIRIKNFPADLPVQPAARVPLSKALLAGAWGPGSPGFSEE